MRYYPAFGVKSVPDALFTRFLSAGNQVAEDTALGVRAFLERFECVLVGLGLSHACFFTDEITRKTTRKSTLKGDEQRSLCMPSPDS
jgi:hypothetical protein